MVFSSGFFHRIKDTCYGLFRISRKGGGPFARGGVPVSDKVSEGGLPKFYGDSEGGGVSIFYTHKKRNRIKQNIPFAQFSHCPGCPFRAIRPGYPDN